ncbi:regulator [Escherichia coli]|nr:regulator [Escherichia coli]
MKRTPFYRRPGKAGKFSGLRERAIWMIQTRGRPVTGSEIAEKFGVTLIEFNRVANSLTRGEGRIAQLVASETWLNEDGICDRTFDLITKPKVITPQGKTRLFTRRSMALAAEGNRRECIEKAARRRRLIAAGLYIDEMETAL